MQFPAKLDLYADRWTPFSAALNFTGLTVTGADLAMQVRQTYDTAGSPLISLTDVASSGDEGLYIASATSVEVLISQAAMEALPDAPETGDDLVLYWDLQITPAGGVKQVYARGKFIVRGGATQ